MTLEQLRIFVAVAERQHVTQAAKVLNRAQSAVSNAINNLEDEFRTKLFNRVGRGIELTEVGLLLLGEARTLLARAASLKLRMSEFRELKRGRIHIHASQTIASYWLPRYLMDFRGRHPMIEISLSIGNTAEVATAVHDGLADLGFIEGAIDDPNLEMCLAAWDKLVLVVSPRHPWAALEKVELDDLIDADWVLREPGSGTRSEFIGALERLGIPSSSLRVTMEFPSNEAVRAAVEAGIAATVISASVAAPSLEAGLLHHVPFDLLERGFYTVLHKERYQNGSVRALIEMLDTTDHQITDR